MLSAVPGSTVLTTSDEQTEDGHAMMESDTFHSFQPRLEPRNAWMSQLCAVSESGIEKENTLDSSQQMCANSTARVQTSPKTDREVVMLIVKMPWQDVGSHFPTSTQ